MRIGPYEILDEVARGGMGVLYRARDPRSGRAVALKLLLIEGEATQRRFAREARAMAQLRHPGIARYYEAGEHKGHPYLAMEFVEGHSLQDRLNREGRLPAHEVRRIGVALCDALEAVHAAGLLHRDLKPANVLQNVAGRVVLTDFGLVKQDAAGRPQTLSLSVLGGLLGTPGYWPPEQARGQLDEIGPHSDVYALGATLYALLCGHPPRAGADLLETLELLDQPVTPLRELHPGIPPDLDAGVLHALELDPAARPDLAQLRGVLTGTASAPPTPTRSRLPLALALGLATLGVAALAWTAWSRSAPATRPDPPPAPRVDPPPVAPTADPQPNRAGPVRLTSAPGSHVTAVSAVAVSPDGESVFSGSLSGELRLWASDSGALLETWLPGVGGFAAVAWCPSAMLAASRSGTLVRIAGGEVHTRPLGHPTCHDLDTDAAGRAISAGSDGLRLWTVEQVRSATSPPPCSLDASVDVARFAPGGGGLALGESGCWRWSAEGVVEVTAVPGSRYSDLAWSPDGAQVALLERQHRISLYRWPELELLSQGRIHKPRDGESLEVGSASLCFDARGERLYTVGIYPQVRVWQVPSLEAAAGGFYTPGRSWSARVRQAGEAVLVGGNSGQLLAFSTASSLPVWRRAPRPLVSPAKHGAGPVVGGMTWFGPRILLSTDEGLQLLDVESGRRLDQPRAPMGGAERLASYGEYLLGIQDGVTVLARARVVGEHLVVDQPSHLQPEPGHAVVDQRVVGHQLFLLYRSEADGRALIHVRDLRTGKRVGQFGPVDLGAGRLHLGDTLSTGRRVWAAGPAQLLKLDFDDAPRATELASPLAYVAEVGDDETLLVGVDGAWQLGRSSSQEVLGQGQWTESGAVKAIGPRRVVLTSEHTARVHDLAEDTELASMTLPPDDYVVGSLAAPDRDALYVWTCRGEVWRLPLPR